LFVCLFKHCLFLCIISGSTHLNFIKFSVHVAYGCGLVLWQHCNTLFTGSSFLWMMSLFPIMSSVAERCYHSSLTPVLCMGECPCSCCVVLVASCPGGRWVSRLNESLVEGMWGTECNAPLPSFNNYCFSSVSVFRQCFDAVGWVAGAYKS